MNVGIRKPRYSRATQEIDELRVRSGEAADVVGFTDGDNPSSSASGCFLNRVILRKSSDLAIEQYQIWIGERSWFHQSSLLISDTLAISRFVTGSQHFSNWRMRYGAAAF